MPPCPPLTQAWLVASGVAAALTLAVLEPTRGALAYLLHRGRLTLGTSADVDARQLESCALVEALHLGTV